MSSDIMSLLDDKKRKKKLIDFSKKELFTESIEFLIDYKIFLNSKNVKQEKLCINIYKTYIKPESKKMLNISQKIVETVEHNILNYNNLRPTEIFYPVFEDLNSTFNDFKHRFELQSELKKKSSFLDIVFIKKSNSEIIKLDKKKINEDKRPSYSFFI